MIASLSKMLLIVRETLYDVPTLMVRMAYS